MLKIVIFTCLVGAITAASLDAVVCGPVCMMYCEYGNVLDANGCATCRCNDPPAAPASDVKCSPVLCRMYCEKGWQKDENGCDICACQL